MNIHLFESGYILLCPITTISYEFDTLDIYKISIYLYAWYGYILNPNGFIITLLLVIPSKALRLESYILNIQISKSIRRISGLLHF